MRLIDADKVNDTLDKMMVEHKDDRTYLILCDFVKQLLAVEPTVDANGKEIWV